jgi:hypothetical protein
MKVYVLVENSYEDHETGGGQVVGVFASRALCFVEMRKQSPGRVFDESGDSWTIREWPTGWTDFDIEEHEVVQETE